MQQCIYTTIYTHTRTPIQKPQIIVTTMKRCTNYPNRPPNHLIHSNVCRFLYIYAKCVHSWNVCYIKKQRPQMRTHQKKKTLNTSVTNKSWNAAGHIRRKTQTITMRERESEKNAYIVHNAHVLAIISSRNLFQSTILSSLILWYFIYIYIHYYHLSFVLSMEWRLHKVYVSVCVWFVQSIKAICNICVC